MTAMSTPTPAASELRLYQGDLVDTTTVDGASVELWNQIPALPNLMKCFEAVTGWELAFKEHRSNLARRHLMGSDSTVHGQLDIIDMSTRIEPGRVAVHRQRSNHLADAISELIGMLQHNREILQGLNQQLTRVVDLPFDWWGIAGQSGFREGQICNWSITPHEQMRLFTAQVHAMDATDQAIASSAMLAAFESACQVAMALDQVALLLPRILRSSCCQGQRLAQFASVELDPITGEFQVDGYEASQCVALLDLSSRAAVNLEAEGLQGILYSGQVLLIGLTSSQRDGLLEVISQTEMTVHEFCRVFERKCSDSAALIVYRK